MGFIVIARTDLQEESTMQQPHTPKGLETYLHKRIKELTDIEGDLARAGHINAQFSRYGKVTLIFLGAFVATKEVANQLLGVNSGINLVIFTVAGLLVAVIAGLEAAFKWENTATVLKGLTADCQKVIREATYITYEIDLKNTDDEKIKDLENTIATVNKGLDTIYSNATALGINLVRDLEERKKSSTTGNS
jgi:hypothetical protein